MKSGLAEVFGTELRKNKKYDFAYGVSIAVFTWHGCTVELVGKTSVAYISKETPMNRYIYCHTAMEAMRDHADNTETRGPVVMVVGPSDIGKTTLSRTLVNCGIRIGRRPIYVDLDCARGQVGIPGTIGALLVEEPADVVDGFNQTAPMIFHYGHTDPNSNLLLYNLMVMKLAKACSQRLRTNRKSNVSGMVINTRGWTPQEGTKILAHAARAFEVDLILVLKQDRLYSELAKEMSDNVKVVHLPKSGGVEERSQEERNEMRNRSLRQYFYGSIRKPLYPHSFEVKWSKVKIFRIGRPNIPSTCMPIGMKAEDSYKKLVEVTPGPNLLHHLLSISFADSSTEDLLQKNIAGYICITNVDVKRQTLTILSPQPGPITNHILLLNEIQFVDTF